MVTATKAVSLPAWSKVLQKGQSTDSLLKRLKDLQDVLNRAEPDGINAKTLEVVRDQLIKDDLLFHKGKEVRASLACCLADLLRLCAPDPPFDGDQLQTIFQFFLSVLTTPNGGLSKPSGPLFNNASTLLEVLVSTRSLLLMWELDSADALITNYFTSFFGVVKPETPKKVELLVSEALAMLLLEADAVPQKVVDILLAHFHPTIKRTNPAAAHLATLVCNAASSELQMSVNQYFTDNILKATTEGETPMLEQSLHKIHGLIIHINKSAPAILGSVIPQLEDGLHAENDTLREASVKTLGQMLGEKAAMEGGGGDLAVKFPTTWKAWLNRSSDKSVAIRLAWVEATRTLIVNHPELRKELEEHVCKKVLDGDEKVRAMVVKVIGSLDYESLRHHVSRHLLESVADRTLDKRESVRLEALDAIGKTFSLAYPEMQSGDEAVRLHFGWIPSQILASKSPYNGQLVHTQHALAKHFLPLPKVGSEDEGKWTDRFLDVMHLADDDAARVLVKMSNLMDPRHQWYTFLAACKRFNGGIIKGSQDDVSSAKAALIRSIELIAQKYFSDPAIAAKELNEFAKQNDARSYKLLELIMDPRTDLRASVKATAEMRKKLLASGTRGNATMMAVMRLAGFPYVSSSSLPTLLATLEEKSIKSKEESESVRRRLSHLFKAIAKNVPSMWTNHLDLCLARVREEGGSADVATVCLMALAKVRECKEIKEKVKLDRSDVQRLQEYINEGSHEEARYAAKLLSLLASDDDDDEASGQEVAKEALEEVCRGIANGLASCDARRLAASLAALKQIVKHAKEALTDVNEVIVKNVLNQVLMKPWSAKHQRAGDGKKDEGEEWWDDEDVDDELRARIIAIQFLTQRCLSYAEDEEIHSLIKPVIRLLFTCMTRGEAVPTLKTNAAARGRLRSVSSVSILKLARYANCESHIGVQDFQTFATTAQDEMFQVRQVFIQKLMKYCILRKSNLPPRYYVLGFMTAFDPEEENRQMVKQVCTQLQAMMTAELRLKYFDVGLARLIHLLNHYPDFANGGLERLDSLKSVAVYLDFYLDSCSTPNNLACLYYIANRCKGHEDRAGQEASEGIYRVSELAMCLIKRRADAMSCNVGDWAGRVPLPVELYRPLPSRVDQNEIYKRSYLSNDLVDYFQQQPLKRHNAGGAKRKVPFRLEEGSKRKAKATGERAGKRAKTKRRRKSRREEEGEEEVGESGSEVETIEDDDEETEESEPESQIDDDEADVSEDEAVEDSGEEGEGRGARVRERQRREKVARNEVRATRRQAKAARAAAA